ncbi:MAG: hypothetical protein QXK37_02480 [Candidatus Woesearchaeota archaeon]
MTMGATVICKKCRQKVSINSVRYDLNGKDLICFDCYDKQQWALKKAGFAERREPASELRLSQVAKSEISKTQKTEQTKLEKPKGERIKYICTSCQYRFTMGKQSAQAKRCPYCGKETLEEDNFDIDALIRESDLSRE